MFLLIRSILVKDYFLTICKISADLISGCWEKRAKLTKRWMISKVDNDSRCCCDDSRVFTGCKEPTGRGGFKAVNRARRWSSASLACTWKTYETDQDSGSLTDRTGATAGAFFTADFFLKKDKLVILKCWTQPAVMWCTVRARWERREQWWALREEADTEETGRWNSDRLARRWLGKINRTSPFLPCTTPISPARPPSHSLPGRKCSLII